MRRFVALTFLFGICIVPTLADDLVNINGKVILHKDDPIPKREAIVPDKDKEVCAKDKEFFTENWVIDAKTRGIRDVVVYIVSEPTDEQAKLIEKDKVRAKVELTFDPTKIPEKLKAPPKEPVVFDIQCCRFVPHVAVARVGQTASVKNSSEVVHQIDWVFEKFHASGLPYPRHRKKKKKKKKKK